MKITLPLWDLHAHSWEVVEAELLPDIAPHLSGTFAVHRNPWSRGATWVVSNVETGAKVEPPHELFLCFTRAEAIRKAHAFLATKTEEQYQAALAEAAKVLPKDQAS